MVPPRQVALLLLGSEDAWMTHLALFMEVRPDSGGCCNGC